MERPRGIAQFSSVLSGCVIRNVYLLPCASGTAGVVFVDVCCAF